MNQLAIMKAGQIRYCIIPEIYIVDSLIIFFYLFKTTPNPSQEGSRKTPVANLTPVAC